MLSQTKKNRRRPSYGSITGGADTANGSVMKNSNKLNTMTARAKVFGRRRATEAVEKLFEKEPDLGLSIQ